MASFWTRKDADEEQEKKTANPFAAFGSAVSTEQPRPRYHVVAGVVVRDGRVLCTQKGATRYAYTSHRWEFPGGKIEAGETSAEALRRELLEELQLEVSVGELFISVRHDYPDFSLTMEAFVCRPLGGEPVLSEHERCAWLLPAEMKALEWCEADVPVMHRAARMLERA